MWPEWPKWSELEGGGVRVETGAAERFGLGADQYVARGGDDPGERRFRRVRQRLGRDDLADEVDGQGLLGVELAAADRQLACDRAADEIVQRPVHDVAERPLGVREPRGRRCDTQVAQDREVEPSRECRS